MATPNSIFINQNWPANDLESVDLCPYCGATESALAFNEVQDWSFYSAPGKWSYWDCNKCNALYLNPRPTELSIGRAYSSYYTHVSSNFSIRESIKYRIRNECFSHWLSANFYPRINLPRCLQFFLLPLKTVIGIPFELFFLAQESKGSLLDVGCGSGGKLKLAKSLGWNVTGLELDWNAVEVARSEGINVIHGDYKKLLDFDETFDCVICSHVLEHVHEPIKLLELLEKRINKNGTLLLSVPNAQSHLRHLYCENWRGLEAPRHLSIPEFNSLCKLLLKHGFEIVKSVPIYNATLLESRRIVKRAGKVSFLDYMKIKIFKIGLPVNLHETDVIQLVCLKK